MQIQFMILILSPRIGSISVQVVAMDAVDMLVGEDHMAQLMQGRGRAWDVTLRKILWLTTDMTKAYNPTTGLGTTKLFKSKDFKGYWS